MSMISAQVEIETKKQESYSLMSGVAEKEIGAADREGARARAAMPQTNAFKRIAAIARNAFREAVRDRVLYNLVLFVLLLIVGAIFLGELSDAQETKIITDMGLSAMLLFGAFISIFVGVGLV